MNDSRMPTATTVGSPTGNTTNTSCGTGWIGTTISARRTSSSVALSQVDSGPHSHSHDDSPKCDSLQQHGKCDLQCFLQWLRQFEILSQMPMGRWSLIHVSVCSTAMLANAHKEGNSSNMLKATLANTCSNANGNEFSHSIQMEHHYIYRRMVNCSLSYSPDRSSMTEWLSPGNTCLA